MVYVNKEGYLERQTRVGKKNPHSKPTKRAWWFVKHHNGGNRGCIQTITKGIILPKKYIGKRVKFKIEVL